MENYSDIAVNSDKVLSVMILDAAPADVAVLKELIAKRRDLKLEEILDVNAFTDRFKNKFGSDICIVNLDSTRQNAKKLINLLPFNNVKIIISDYKELAYDAYNAGALDYLVKPLKPERFFQALDKAIAYSLSPYRPTDKYSQLEKNNMFYNVLQNEYHISDPCCEICKLVLTGQNRAEISKALNISENTLKVYLREIYSRTIEKEYDNPTLARSKFHLLYMFLNKIYNSL